MSISAAELAPSISSYILRMAKYKEQTAFVEQGVYRSQEYSYRLVVERASAFSAWLRRCDLGAMAGREAPRVVLRAIPSARWAMAFYGCILAGATVVPVDAGFSPEFLGRIVSRSGASLLITDRAGQQASARTATDEMDECLVHEIDGMPTV